MKFLNFPIACVTPLGVPRIDINQEDGLTNIDHITLIYPQSKDQTALRDFNNTTYIINLPYRTVMGRVQGALSRENKNA
jgi:hypothetical protein